MSDSLERLPVFLPSSLTSKQLDKKRKLKEKLLIIEWIINNVTADVVTGAEGSTDGLIFNLVNLVVGSKERYKYTKEQDDNLEEWIKSKGDNLPGLHWEEILTEEGNF